MKTLSVCGALAAGLVTCFAGTADAAGLITAGSACIPYEGTPVVALHRTNSWIGNEDDSDTYTFVCPIAVDHTIGTSADFTIVVEDATSSGSFSCGGFVYDVNGNYVDAVVGMSTPVSMMGVYSLTGSVNVTPSTNNTYVVICDIPPLPIGSNISKIFTARVN